MTDIEALFLYRLKQSEETLSDANKMIQSGLSPRSIINRAYYAMFYAILALFLKTGVNIKTSKHIGVISTFDREFIKTGKIGRRYSEMLHDLFDSRLEGDYKEYVEITADDAIEHVKFAEEFLKTIKDFINKTTQ